MYEPGQDVLVCFDGVEYPGEVLEHSKGWVQARICIDPLADHGDVTPMLGLRPIVNVRESDVQTADSPDPA